MAENTADPLIQFVRKAGGADGGQDSDGRLLERYLHAKDESAFGLLMQRHGPMVMGVCRRVLQHSQDAEDAFQATFLVLVRKATSIVPREKVGCWLYGVAYRVAREAKTIRARRRWKEAQAAIHEAENPDHEAGELRAELDHHLHALPEKFRFPVLLCDLQGKTQAEAAQQLGWPQGTVSGRLFQGRKMLAARLQKHGVIVSAGALPVVLSQQVWSYPVPDALSASTVNMAVRATTDRALALSEVSTQVSQLARGVLRMMWIKRMKTIAVSIVVIGLLAACGLLLTWQLFAGQPTPPPKNAGEVSGRNAGQPKPASAKQLFDAMESKLIKAKTLQCKLSIVMQTPGRKKPTTLEGELWLATKNKMNLTLMEKSKNAQALFIFKSDGVNMAEFKKGKPEKRKTGPFLQRTMLLSLTRSGVQLPLYYLLGSDLPNTANDPVAHLQVNKLKFVKKATVNNVKTSVVQYELKTDFAPVLLDVTVWIDSAISLPVKRSVTMGVPGGKKEQSITITENYSDWVINQDIDEKRFQIPKK